MKACKNGDHNKERKFHFYINIYNAQTQDEGRYLYDVRTEGGGGGTQYVTNTTDRLRECVTKGGEGVQNPENFADVI